MCNENNLSANTWGQTNAQVSNQWKHIWDSISGKGYLEIFN